MAGRKSQKKAPPEEMFFQPLPFMTKKSIRIVTETMLRRPYYGTKLDRELKYAKDRARANRC